MLINVWRAVMSYDCESFSSHKDCIGTNENATRATSTMEKLYVVGAQVCLLEVDKGTEKKSSNEYDIFAAPNRSS